MDELAAQFEGQPRCDHLHETKANVYVDDGVHFDELVYWFECGQDARQFADALVATMPTIGRVEIDGQEHYHNPVQSC